MVKKQLYQCKDCKTNKMTDVIAEKCECGGKYIKMPAQTQSTYGSLGITKKKRRTEGFRRTKTVP